MHTKFKMPDRLYFPVSQRQYAEHISLSPAQTDTEHGIVVSFVDREAVIEELENILRYSGISLGIAIQEELKHVEELNQ